MKTCQLEQLLRLLLLLVLPFFFAAQNAEAAPISTKQSGAWTSAATWEGNVVPTNFQEVIIKAGHTVTRNNAFVCQGTLYLYGTLVYNGNVAREFYFGTTIELQGTLVVQAGSLYADGLVYGNGTFRQIDGTTTFGRAYVVENTDIQGGLVNFANTNNGNLHLDKLTLKNATLNANGNTDIVISVSMDWNNKGKVLAGTNIRIEPGASLTFDGGNSTHTNDGFIANHGTIYCSSGSLNKSGGTGYIGNYGLWQFSVQANANFFVNQFVDNSGGKILKTGPGGVEFSSSGDYHDAATSTFHVQQGGATLTNSSDNTLEGLWQVDVGASVLIFAKDGYASLPFDIGKFINNGNVYGRVKFIGDDLTILEGNGKFNKMEIAKSANKVSLSSNAEVSDEFVLSNGRIVLNQYDLRLENSSISYTSDLDSYIETNGLGSCVRNCPVGGSTFFPIGNARFAPFSVDMKAGGTPDQVKVRVIDSFYGEYNGNTAACSGEVTYGVVDHTWFVAEQTPGGSNAEVSAFWLPASEWTDFERSACTLSRYVNGNWEATSFTPAEDLPPLLAAYRSSVTNFGIFGVLDAAHTSDANFITPVPNASTPVCEWNDLQLQANTSQHADIQWTGPNGYQSNQADPMITGVQLSQSGIYAVKAAQYGCPEKQATVTVLVNAEPNPTILGPTSTPAGSPVILVAYGGNSYLWSTGDASQSITVSPTQTTDYQVTVTNPSGCTATATHLVQVTGVSATHELEGVIGQMKIAPNPAIESTVLTFESMTGGLAQLLITDARGVQLYRQNTVLSTGANQMTLPLTTLTAGAYQVTLIRENEVKTVRLMKLTAE